MNNQDRIPARCKSNDYGINARARIDSREDLKDTRLREFYSKQERITRINSDKERKYTPEITWFLLLLGTNIPRADNFDLESSLA